MRLVLAVEKHIPSRYFIAIFAGGGKNATGGGAAMIIFLLLRGPPDCNERNWCSRAFRVLRRWRSFRSRSHSSPRAGRVRATRGFESRLESRWKPVPKAS